MKEDVLLEVKELSIWGRGRRLLLDDVSFRMEDGETVSVVGHAGSGKTVLLEGMTRLGTGQRYAGHVHLRGYEHNLLRCRRGRLRRIRGGQISYLPGDPEALMHPAVPVGEQMAALMRRHRPEVRDWREESVYWLHQAGIAEPEVRLRLRAGALDIFSRVRLGVAMAFCTFPRLLLADDPTRRLDVSGQADVLELLEKLREKMGIGMIYATRDLRVGMEMGSRVILLDEGRVALEEGRESVVSRHARALGFVGTTA
ncbi:MAG: ATP-binding cassette domain-containing protein [Verrucomicrobiota bacterium]